MDSLTQILLGGAVAAAIAPARHRRAALLAGAALGTLPDLDGIPIALLTDDPVLRMTWHRGPTHSLLVLPWLAWAIWAFFRRRGGRVAEAPRRWWWAILLALITHPLLDAFTVYGTQLLWPIPVHPAMWSSVFIIDPLYTVWLLLACLVAWWARERAVAQRALVAGLVLSSVYLGWSLLAKQQVERRAAPVLAGMGLADAPRFSVPQPFTTWRWQVVAMAPEGYVSAAVALGDGDAPVFSRHGSDLQALAAAAYVPAVRQLQWFNRGFMRARIEGDELVLSDLRMGSEPDYFFNFAVARRDGEGPWQPLHPPRQLPVGGEGSRGDQWRDTWRRLRGPSRDDEPRDPG